MEDLPENHIFTMYVTRVSSLEIVYYYYDDDDDDDDVSCFAPFCPIFLCPTVVTIQETSFSV